MSEEKLKLIRGGKNVYDDLGVVDADVRQLKSLLAAEIIKVLDDQGLTVRQAHALTGIDTGDFSRIRNADFRCMSVERLMTIINRLGLRVEVSVHLQRQKSRRYHGDLIPA